MAVGNSVTDVWLGKFSYPITPELEALYYTNNRIQYDTNQNITTISSKDFECFIHDINDNFKHIHNLSRKELLDMHYRLSVFRNNTYAFEVWYQEDPLNTHSAHLVYKSYQLKDPPYRMKENILRVVYRTSKFDMEM